MLFDSEKKIYKTIEEEKKYIWAELETLKGRINESHEQLKELQKSAPEHFKQAASDSKTTSQYRNRTKKASEEAEVHYSKVRELLTRLNELEESSNSIKDSIVNINSESNDTLASFKATQSEIEQLHDRAHDSVVSLNDLEQKKLTLESDFGEISSKIEETNVLLTRSKSLFNTILQTKKSVQEAHDEIFGYVEENSEGEEIAVLGLKEKLETSYLKLREDTTALSKEVLNLQTKQSESLQAIEESYHQSVDNFVSTSMTQYETIKEKVESLLPSAMTAGLAGAYVDKIQKEKDELSKHESSFRWGIRGLIICSLLPIGFVLARVFFLEETFTSVMKDTPLFFSMMAPLYAPILWVAYSSNKSYKLSKRLIEEYTHKEVSSRTFEGLSTQITNIGEDDTSGELRTRLLFNLLQVNSENPGKLISDYNNSDHPILDAIDKSSKLTDAIKKLDNIPLIGQLLNHVNSREQMKLAEQTRDTEQVLKTELSKSEDIDSSDKSA
ncbi:TPA: hypothetical protein I7117_17380 [Vibrio vulnificus]|nr:hypothetical protein [Vibrio vulnificus]HAT8553766.1 hypothetical protein [Vibrio vulnificus]HDY8121656.1 hypothetical protein [Vibrio vulnificus]HDZ3270564.1 hypothetical protein [Vibrio vulnificus]